MAKDQQSLQGPLKAILSKSEEMPEGSEVVQGYDFNQGVDYHQILQSYRFSGFQATNFGLAVEQINTMLQMRDQPLPAEKTTGQELNDDPITEITNSCTIFLGYTSNMVSCGVRDTIRFLAQYKMIDCIVSTAGGVEEDIIKCLAPTYIGDFQLKGSDLKSKGFNRQGNLIVPNNNYCKFSDWIFPILDEMLDEQKTKGVQWTPSKLIEKIGLKINDESSIYYWAAKNKIPVLSPAITDGSIGDMLYFHSYKNPGLVLDLVQDIRRINNMAVKAVRTGLVIIGGGVAKHHICNANAMRNGANFSVYVNTSSEFDGSDSGARPDEAVSWGKISKDAKPVKVYGEASLVFPLLVAETFARHHFNMDAKNGKESSKNNL